MIKLNQVFFWLFLLLLLSLESVLALPIFSTFLFFKWLDRFSWKNESFLLLFLALLLAAFTVALFYQISFSVSLLIFCLYYFWRSFLGGRLFGKSRQQWQFFQLSLFALFQLALLLISGIEFNIFLLIELILAAILFSLRSSTFGRL